MNILDKIKRFFAPPTVREFSLVDGPPANSKVYFCIRRTGGEGTSPGSTHWDEFYRADTGEWVTDNELYSLWSYFNNAEAMASVVGGEVVMKTIKK